MNSLALILSKRLYFAPAWVFASLNIITGTWVLYLPYIKTKFGLNDGQLGLALFFTALGLFMSIPIIPYINKKIGVGRSTKICVLLFALSFNLPLISPNYWSLCACLWLVGVFSGSTDVSMNALVSTIETEQKQPFMSAAHGFFSLGGFIGAGIGSILIVLFSRPALHMLSISIFVIITNLFLSKSYIKIQESEPEKEDKKEKLQNIRPLIGLALIAFIIMFNEGAVEHWSNLFLFDVVQVSASKAGFGFIAFSLCMTIGRFFGDSLSEKIGAVNMILYGTLIAFASYFLILTSHLYGTVIGFGVLGLGLSVIVPELFRLAGRVKGVSVSRSISIVSGIGFLGFVIGPILLGIISNWTNLTGSYIFLTIFIFVALVVSLLHLKKSAPKEVF